MKFSEETRKRTIGEWENSLLNLRIEVVTTSFRVVLSNFRKSSTKDSGFPMLKQALVAQMMKTKKSSLQ
jgi:hypothetical protein